MTTVPIHLASTPERRYDVLVQPGALADLGPRIAAALGAGAHGVRRRAFMVADAGLPGWLIDAARVSLDAAGFDAHVELVAPSESIKSLDSVSHLLERIIATRHERTDPVIAIGGGIVGDIAGFVASIYRRGVPVIQCPTTLLAMVDASVGGKTGVNLRAGDTLKKNMVGCFWQPRLVVADPRALASLPDRHLRCGLAECIKHGLISRATDPDLFSWTRAALPRVLARDAGVLSQLIERNVRVKASFVAGDEREEAASAEGGRAILNLGHTFGHAIETIPHLSPTADAGDAPLHHGEAVALGLVAAAATSAALGLLAREDAESVRAAVDAAGLPSRVAHLPGDDAILAAMSHDKKVAGGRLRLVLLRAIGDACVIEDPPTDAVIAGLRAIRAT